MKQHFIRKFETRAPGRIVIFQEEKISIHQFVSMDTIMYSLQGELFTLCKIIQLKQFLLNVYTLDYSL